MKIKSVLIVILAAVAFSNSFGQQKTRFFIMSKLVGSGDQRRVAGAVSYFITSFDNKLKKIYPCTTVLCENDIGTLLGHERMRQLLGSETPGLMESISDALGCEYLISLEIGTLPGEKFVVNASLIPYKTKFPVLHASAYSDLTATSGGKNLDNCDEVAQKLVDWFKNKEVCPYKGDVKVRVLSELNVDTKKEYPVYCQGEDRTYLIQYKADKRTNNDWKLKKMDLYRTTGTINFNISEETDKVIENGCYKCANGTVTRRYYHETHSQKGDISGLSHDSQIKGLPVDDARIEIKFGDDGTYSIKVDATSTKGDLTENNFRTSEGWCDEIKDPPQTIVKKADIPLHYIFGPYQGTSQDKILKVKPDPIVKTDPVSGEKTTIYIEFDLERE